METIISRSLSNNNDERKQATKQICEVLKRTEGFQQFWAVVAVSNNADIRLAAGVYFYRMLHKKKKWLQLQDEIRNSIKASVLEKIYNEPEKKVKTVVVQSAGLIALVEPDNWPQLFKLIENCFEGSTEMKELSMFVISILTEHAAGLFELHVTSLLNLFGSILTKLENHGTPLAYLTVISMKNFLISYPQKEKLVSQSFECLIPFVLEVIKMQSSRNRPDRSIECLSFFEALLDSYPRVITYNMKDIIENLLRVAVLVNIDEVSSRTLDVISCIICQKTKKVAKDEAILDMLSQTLYEIISSSKPLDNSIDHYDVFNGDVNIINAAIDLLDTLATEIDADVLMKHIMPILDVAANSDNIFAKKAVYIILGVMVDKCTKQIGSAGFDRIILFVNNGLSSDDRILLNGALFTTWRFVEYLKPEINLYLIGFMTPLLQLLSDAEGRFNMIEGHLVPKIYYILNECCDTSDVSLEQILPSMVPVLISIVNSRAKIHHRELAINVLGQAGVATKSTFRQYFSVVLEVLRPFLVDDLPEDQLPLQVQTFDTLGSLFKNLYVEGDELQLVVDLLELTLSITERKNCGELRSGLYSMLSDCSEFMKEEMTKYLPRILKLMESSFKTKDSLNGEQHGDDMTLDTVSKVCKDLKVIEEKEEALMALGNLAYNVGVPFQLYLGESYIICNSLSTHENQVIRAAAMEALANIYIAIQRLYVDVNTVTVVPNECSGMISKFATVVKEDENVDVVYAVLEGYQKILKDIPQIVNMSANDAAIGNVNNGSLIASGVKIIITEKSTCQKLKMREDNSDDDEYDQQHKGENASVEDEDDEIDDNYSAEDLIIAAEEIIPLIGETVSTETFVTFFCSCQRHLLKLLEKHQPSEVRESTSATLGLCAKYLSSYMNEFAIEFAPIFPTLLRDTDDNVRNNVAFSLAQMVLCGKETMYPYFQDVATSLLNWLQIEPCSMVVDNICGALASMVVSNYKILPMNDIVPALFRFLPLREDFDENLIVFRSLNVIFEEENFKEYLPRAVEVVLTSSIHKQIVCDGARQEAMKLFELLSICYPNEKNIIFQTLPVELRNHFFESYK